MYDCNTRPTISYAWKLSIKLSSHRLRGLLQAMLSCISSIEKPISTDLNRAVSSLPAQTKAKTTIDRNIFNRNTLVVTNTTRCLRPRLGFVLQRHTQSLQQILPPSHRRCPSICVDFLTFDQNGWLPGFGVAAIGSWEETPKVGS